MKGLLSSAGLSPTNLSPTSNQIIKLIFYPDSTAQSEKRQVISKWAIVLRELELAGIKPGNAKVQSATSTSVKSTDCTFTGINRTVRFPVKNTNVEDD